MIVDTANRHCRSARSTALIGLLTFFVAGFAASGWAQHSHDDDHADERDHHVPLFPTAGNEYRQGFVRIISRDDHHGEVHIQAIDDTGHEADEITLTIDGMGTVHFNSDDLENGGTDAEEKGLSDSTGAPMGGDWRLKLTSSLDIEVLAYIRHEDGFLTSMTDTAPSHGPRHRVAVFNPGSNPNQVSHLRLINPGDESAQVNIVGIDDGAESPGETVGVSVGPGQALTLSAEVLEDDSSDFAGKLGDGSGKWQLNIVASESIMVMSLMESTMTNQLTNLSTAPMTEFETAREVFDADVSPSIVQTKCINCHVEGGQSGHTPLVFVGSSTDDHEHTNFDVFKDYVADSHDDHDHDHDSPVDVILDKIQGNQTHGGGEQVRSETEDFRNMQRFLWILEDEVADEPDDHAH